LRTVGLEFLQKTVTGLTVEEGCLKLVSCSFMSMNFRYYLISRSKYGIVCYIEMLKKRQNTPGLV
jgi:hypothetical protein